MRPLSISHPVTVIEKKKRNSKSPKFCGTELILISEKFQPSKALLSGSLLYWLSGLQNIKIYATELMLISKELQSSKALLSSTVLN